MDLFSSAPLSKVGKPILFEFEIEIKSSSRIDILLEPSKEGFLKNGIIVLTNFRIVYIANGSSAGWSLLLSNVKSTEDCSTMLSNSSRISVSFLNSPKVINIKFGASKTEKVEFLDAFKRQLSKKSWEQVSKLVVHEEEKFSTGNAGVGGLIRKQERDMAKVDSVTKEALSDLESLMRSARDVISVVQRYAAFQQDRSEQNLSDTSTDIGERNEMESIMQSIGIVSPVTKFSAGRLFHTELSRQLADVLLRGDLLRKMGGMASVTDVYCVFNRARGTELISPNDFLHAAEELNHLQLGISFQKFPSGVMNIHLDEFDESSSLKRFLSLFAESEISRTGLSANTAAKRMKISLVVVKEQLLACERRGDLCRDESMEGLFFFPNLFKTTYSALT